MTTANPDFLKLQSNYLFADIARKVAAYKAAHPAERVISLGIGDVTRPLPPAILTALHQAVDEMGEAAHFRGYGPEQGYDFLRSRIVECDYAARGVSLSADEVFISDGAKSDIGNFQELFAPDSRVAVTDPVYRCMSIPMRWPGGPGKYAASSGSASLSAMHTGKRFCAGFPQTRPDIIYLCYRTTRPAPCYRAQPCRPGWIMPGVSVASFSLIRRMRHSSPIRMCHTAFTKAGRRPGSRSRVSQFLQDGGFTGLRCAYTVVPKALQIGDGRGQVSLNALWNRRQCTKYNGCPYIVQRAAEAVCAQGQRKSAPSSPVTSAMRVCCAVRSAPWG